MSKKNLLPRPSGELHLRKYGYNTHSSDLGRHRQLMSAVRGNGKTVKPEKVLEVMRHLNLLTNLQGETRAAKSIMREDVEYLKAKYHEYKKK